MSESAFVVAATDTEQAKTFTVTYTFPPGAVDAAKRCCELAGLTVIDTTDDATVKKVANAIAGTPCQTDQHLATQCPTARSVLAALRGGATSHGRRGEA